MTRRRISNRTPRELTAKERSALSDVVLELDSDFRVKTGSVDDVSQVLPEAGVMVISEHDGRMYYADNYGWHKFGEPYSLINLFVDFNGTDQFVFKFKLPATSTLEIHDGDGTVTDVAGNDATEVTHTTNYATAGTYYFYVDGDVRDITFINIGLQSFVSGDVSSWAELINLTHLYCFLTSVTGDISGWSALTNLETVRCHITSVSGDISGWSVLTSLTDINCSVTNVTGDISGWSVLTSLTRLTCSSTSVTGDMSGWSVLVDLDYLWCNDTNLGWNGIGAWSQDAVNIRFQDNHFTSIEVDNCLISLASGPVTNCTIDLAGNNAARTTASDAAFAQLDAANTLTVNE